MSDIITTRFLMRDRFTKRTVLEFEDHVSAMKALHALAPIRQEKYELIPQVITKRTSGGARNAKTER